MLQGGITSRIMDNENLSSVQDIYQLDQLCEKSYELQSNTVNTTGYID